MAQLYICEGIGLNPGAHMAVVLWDTTSRNQVESDAKFRGNYLPSFPNTRKK